MNFEISDDQTLIRDSFARFLNEHSSMVRVRAALPSGFDPALWKGLAEQGTFSVRIPDALGGSGLGTLDAAIIMEEVGRTLASGPIAETILAARLLAVLARDTQADLLARLIAGDALVTLAYHALDEQPRQWVAGGAVASHVVARDGDSILLISVPQSIEVGEPNLASTPIAELELSSLERTVLASGAEALTVFLAAIEEWKLLMAAALAGLARETIRLAADYATQRTAFGQPIGSFQGVSHPLADSVCEVDAGKYYTWKAICDIAADDRDAAAKISLALWWNSEAATRAVQQSLQTFGGYGLTTEYDIHLFNLRAKAWPLVFGDPWRLLEEGGRRLYAGEAASLPDVGAVSIDFDLGEEAMALARETDAFFREHLTPELRAKAHYSWDGHDAGLHKKLAQAGLLFPSWPKELGGRAASPYSVKASRGVWEDHKWSSHAAGVTEMVGVILRKFASDELRRDVLTGITAGEVICSLGYSEPGSGSDVFAAKTRATRDGDGWRINGQKMFTSGANIADYVFLLARTDPEASKHKGLTMFLVPIKSEGVTVHPVYTFQDERTNVTYYDNVWVPDSYRLGDVDQGVRVMAAGLEMEQGGGHSKPMQSMVEAAEELCREIVYRGRPLIEDQTAQARLARARAQTELGNLLILRTGWAAVEGKPAPGFGPMGRMFAADRFLQSSTDMLDLTAPLSLSKRSGAAAFINQCYRHAHGTRIYGGTREVHRSSIAERYLGLPRSRMSG